MLKRLALLPFALLLCAQTAAATTLPNAAPLAVGEWETVEITVDHGNLTIKPNGEVQNSATCPGSLNGKIGPQVQGGEMEFRKTQLTPIE